MNRLAVKGISRPFVLFVALAIAAPLLMTNHTAVADEANAVVYIIRARAEPTAFKAKLFVNGEKVAAIPNKAYSSVRLSPGTHDFEIKWSALAVGVKTVRSLDVQAGHTYYLELRSHYAGTIGLDVRHYAEIAVLDEQVAKAKINSCCRWIESRISGGKPLSASQPHQNGGASDFHKLLSGKTVTGTHVRRGFGFKLYFDPNGILIQKKANGKKKVGRWSIDNNGRQCFIWNNKTGCGKLVRNADGSYNFFRKGKIARQYHSFEEGNQID